MSVLATLLLALACLLLAVVALAPFVERIDRVVTRTALHLFRDTVERWAPGPERPERLLQAVHSTATYPVYAARAILFSLVAGIVAAVFGGYAAHAALAHLIAHREAVREALPGELHFVVDPTPTLNPLAGLTGSDGSGGIAVPLDLPPELVSLVPESVRRGVAVLLSLLPPGLRPSLPDQVVLGPSGGASTPAERETVEILIRLPPVDVVPASLTSLSLAQLSLLLLAAVALGAVVAVAAYFLQWYGVKNTADTRAMLIDKSLARTIAFVYALSRSGMLYPEILRTVGENRRAFGESAEEIEVVVKEMELYGTDIVSAQHGTARWTPSERFADFLKNFANVLESGRNVTEYLRDQYEQYQKERVANQEQILELFTALGEGYVAVLVAGPLFLITTLTLLGMLTGGMLMIIQLMIYCWIPLSNVGFIYYVGRIGEPLSMYQAPISQTVERRPLTVRRSAGSAEAVADGGTAAHRAEGNLRRLDLYNRLGRLRWALEHPVETVTARPVVLLYVTVPLAIASIVVRWWLGAPDVTARTADDWVIQAALVVTATFAAAQEIHTRRLRKIEAAIPDFLDSLASTNEAGMTFTESLRRIDQGEFSVLSAELERLLADIEWGGRTERALHRFSQRIGSPTVARIVALITNALRASGHIGPVIRIAADEARQDSILKRKRRQEMFMYVVIVYISFIVFLGIAVTLKTVLVPAIPSADQLAAMNDADGSLGLSVVIVSGREIPKASYTLALFHAAVVQAVLSGLVAGKMGEGSVKSGAKHVTVMLAMAYLVFLLLG